MPHELVVRKFRAHDRGRVASLLSGLSPESLCRRFHSAGVQMDAAMLDSVTAGQALVAELDGKLIGLAAYSRPNSELGILGGQSCARSMRCSAYCNH